ncbi:hypothetical protein H0H81_011791 [Sphagnurus paluster]|uniref:Transmembrane protein n=1 Tax=Sphagnurus paluster TaxID=117069 RepID=A0A9P7K4Y3_9AGAR|nr:hypothetical protein H0H81_011791 [Sphagnurus paluster]
MEPLTTAASMQVLLALWLAGTTNAQQIIVVRHRSRTRSIIAGCVVGVPHSFHSTSNIWHKNLPITPGGFFLICILLCLSVMLRNRRQRARNPHLRRGYVPPPGSVSAGGLPPVGNQMQQVPIQQQQTQTRSVGVVAVGRRPLFSPWRRRRRGLVVVSSNTIAGPPPPPIITNTNVNTNMAVDGGAQPRNAGEYTPQDVVGLTAPPPPYLNDEKKAMNVEVDLEKQATAAEGVVRVVFFFARRSLFSVGTRSQNRRHQ